MVSEPRSLRSAGRASAGATNGEVIKISELFRESDRKPHFKRGLVSMSKINVLTQTRRDFENIIDLSENLASQNLMNLLIVAQLNERSCRRFLLALNRLWGRSHELSELTRCVIDGKRYYLILIAGERRLRSLRRLYQEGCNSCREAAEKSHHTLAPGECFATHDVGQYGGDLIEVTRGLNIPPLEAIYLQLAENTHMSVPPEQEAFAYAHLFNLVKQADPDYTLARFAQQVGRSSSKIRDALKFVGLPDEIQQAVAKKIIPYGLAIEITRLKNQLDATDAELTEWFVKAVVKKTTLPKFRELVTTHIVNRTNGQATLEGFELTADDKRKQRKRTVQAETLKAFDDHTNYFRGVKYLLDQGLLDQEDSPFSMASPRRRFLAEIDFLWSLVPYMSRRSRKIRRSRPRERLRWLKRKTVHVMKQDGQDPWPPAS